MVQTISVLALDAADYELLKRWNCENILLENSQGIDTFAHTYDLPYTPEVWASVATGKTPDELGIDGRGSNWTNPVLNTVSSLTSVIPDDLRTRAGKLLEYLGFSSNIRNDKTQTVFDSGLITQWPGITDAINFSHAQELLSLVDKGEISESKLRTSLLSNTGMELGWLSAIGKTDVPIGGCHSHILDVAGHVYSSREEKLKRYYKVVDEMVGIMVDCCDEVVIISDHGMEVEFLHDSNPGKHSWRAFISSTLDSDLPTDVRDVHGWLQETIQDNQIEESNEQLDAPTDHLRALGYFE